MTIAELFGTRYPVIQAPMAGVQDSALAIAVSNAGGLGSLPCAMLSGEQLGAELTAMRGGTKHPYNVNFFCHTPAQNAPEREVRWREVLAPFYRELGVDPATIAAAPQRQPFNHHMADILEPFRPAVVSFHFGLPTPALVQRVKGWGSKVLSSATTVDEALWLESQGVYAIIAQGLEAGGHRGMFMTAELTSQIGTLALLPQVVRRVQIPVIAAGGIADAAAVRAAMALGAAGVQVGTSYLLAREARTSAVHRAALQSSQALHTALTNVFTGRPARGIVNRVVRELGVMSESAPAFPLAGGAMAPLRASAEALCSGDFSPLWAGQNTSGCRDAPAAEITAALAKGFD
jgi:nitronate monooxygenase